MKSYYLLVYKTPCSPLKVNRRFGGRYRLNFYGRRICQASMRVGGKQNGEDGLLLGLCLDPEDGGDMFLRNVG
jgi:hypothetical protein